MPGSPVVDIQNSYGIAFIGLIVSIILYGMTITQTWFYFLYYRNRDSMALRVFIVSLFALDTVQTMMCIYAFYWYLVQNFGNAENLGLSMWAMNYQVDVAGVVSFLVQLFYARRVYIMSNSVVFPLIIAVLGSITLSLGFVISAKGAALKEFSRWHSLNWITCVGMGSSALADILIVLSMCWCLYHKRTGFSKTDSMIMTLITYSINTGLVTSLLAIATLVSFTVASGLVSLAFFLPLGKCYVNSLLAMLNNRDYLRERSSHENNSGGNAFALSSVRHSNAPFASKTGPTAVAVTVHQSATSDFSEGKHDYENEINMLGLVKEGVTTLSVSEGLSESIV